VCESRVNTITTECETRVKAKTEELTKKRETEVRQIHEACNSRLHVITTECDFKIQAMKDKYQDYDLLKKSFEESHHKNYELMKICAELQNNQRESSQTQIPNIESQLRAEDGRMLVIPVEEMPNVIVRSGVNDLNSFTNTQLN